jgi:hypothetical protein
MAAGRPLIVSDHGWYSEIPSPAAAKIPADDEAALLDAMRRFGRSAALRESAGSAGRRYTDSSCAPESVAEAYSQALRRIASAVKVYG